MQRWMRKDLYEIRHLGQSVQNMAKQIQVLMADIVSEHEETKAGILIR